MEERIVQFRVGVLVLAAIIITVILVLLFGELPSLVQGRYTLYVHFPQAPGVSPDTPVRKYGILIGRVTNVEFAQGVEGAIVTIAINSSVTLRHNEICQVATRSLLGDTELQFVRSNDPNLPDTPIEPGELLAGFVTSDPLRVITNLEGSLADAIGSVANTSDEIGGLARRITDLLDNNQEEISRVVAKAEQALDGIRSITDSVDQLLDPEARENLSRSLEQFPAILDDTKTLVSDFKGTLARVDANLQNLEGLTKPLGEKGEEIVHNVNRTLQRVDQMTAEIGQFTRQLNSSDGTLSRLLNDPELYQSLVRSINNVEQATRQLRPILDDARVITDKISRHPEDLGVRGLIQRRTGIK